MTVGNHALDDGTPGGVDGTLCVIDACDEESRLYIV